MMNQVLIRRCPPVISWPRAPLLLRLALGLTFALAGWGLYGLIAGVSEARVLYMPFLPAVVCAAVLLGFFPGAVCTLVSALIIWFWILPAGPVGIRGGWLWPEALGWTGAGDAVAMGTFLASALFMSAVGGLARRAGLHQSALRRSEERYRVLFESIDEGFCIFEMIFDDQSRPLDYRWLEANEAFERHTGLKDPVGKTARQLVPNLDESWFRIYGEVALTGEPKRFENYAPAMGRWFDVYAFRFGDPLERKVALVFNDITKRKQAEQAARQSQQRLEDIFESAPAFMAVLRGPELVFEKANASYLQIVGGRDIIGRPLLEALPEVANQPYPQMLRRVLETGEPIVGRSAQVLLARYPGGPAEAKTVDFAYLPLREADGTISGVLAHGVDLTERVKAEEAVRASEERYRAVVEGQAEMVCRFLRDGTLLFVNGAYARNMTSGSKPEALIGANFWEFVSRQDRPSVEAMLDSLRPDAPEVRIENRIDTPGGPRWTLWHNRGLVFDEHGQAVELQSAGIDITDRKIAEEALRRANSDLLQFASAASHDLKEPLRGISRLASFISADERSLGNESRQRLDRIRALCARLTAMVSGLIDHARTGLEPRMEECDLNEIVRRVVDTSAEELGARGCAVILRGRLPVVHADRVLMERVFANLIANAVKFNQSPVKRVEIFWEAQDGAVAVRDNGIGIDPKHQQAIFRVFRRVHAPEQYPGEGLGLALVRKIIEAHDGTIEVESAPGAGSTFRVWLAALSPGADGPEKVLVRPQRDAGSAAAAEIQPTGARSLGT